MPASTNAPRADRTAPSADAPLLRCFNVKYSPNLGDGLLSECLERALIDLGADPGTDSIDLAARKAYGDAMMGRDTIMKVLDALPPALRRLAVRAPLALNGLRKWRPHYAARLEGADGVVIGGGNLLSDLDLNFPTKLSLALAEADRRGLPSVIYGCGVSGGWSAAGLAMGRKAFARKSLKAVFVRDSRSKELWDEMMATATGHVAAIVRDPGLLVSDLHPAAPRPSEGPKTIGLGIMSPIAIRYHGPQRLGDDELAAWYLSGAKALVAAGHRIAVFTNGSPEDRVFADLLRPDLGRLGAAVEFQSPQTPKDLCAIIAGCDALVAFRMHAIIAAYSYGVPAIALSWDSKLDAFMASVERSHLVHSVSRLPADALVAVVDQAIAEGIPSTERQAVIADARDGVQRAFAVLDRAISSSRGR